MKATIDAAGRLLIPKPLREALGLAPGTTVDIALYGGGIRITPGGQTARLETASDGRLVATSKTEVTDEVMLALIDSLRR